MQNYSTKTYQELRELANAKTPTPVNLILDKPTIRFLLDLNVNNRNLVPSVVNTLIRSIGNVGWKSAESLCVTSEAKLGNGQHRLTALEALGYPEGICATVVFGVDHDSILVLDQHSKRSAVASLKISLGQTYKPQFLAAIRQDILCNAETMSIGSRSIHTSELTIKLNEWERYRKEMPLLFHFKTVGIKLVSMTAPMVLAIVHYRQRAGVNKANNFLKGFWGEKDVAPDSPEQKAMNYRLTMNSFHQRPGSIYRVFAWLLLAHYEKRGNPKIREAASWGILNNIRT